MRKPSFPPACKIYKVQMYGINRYRAGTARINACGDSRIRGQRSRKPIGFRQWVVHKKQLSKPEADERLKKIPVFKYHPNPFMTGAFYELSEAEICSCCNKPVFIKYKGPFYSLEEPECLCPGCIASGKAAEKFDGNSRMKVL